MRDQVAQKLLAARLAQIQRALFLLRAITLHQTGTPRPQSRIASPYTGWFQLDDLGTHVAEQLAAKRAGDQLPEFEHADVGERAAVHELHTFVHEDRPS